MEGLENLTVVELKKLLKERGLPSYGRKSEMIARLESSEESSRPSAKYTRSRGDREEESDAMVQLELETPRKTPRKPRSRTARKASNPDAVLPPSVSPKRTRSPTFVSKEPANILRLWKAPHLVFYFASKFLLKEARKAGAYLLGHKALLWTLIVSAVVTTVLHVVEGPHRSYLGYVDDVVLWYSYWVFLGIMSSIGLGTGAHTFVLFLGPLIAKATAAAFECSSLEFDLHGPNAFQCPHYYRKAATISVLSILSKVKLEAFFWGAGTAIGELPPYFVALASARSGRHSSEIDQLAQIENKKPQELTWAEWSHIKMHALLKYFGFWGILLAASIPNPLFDLAGITCGYFKVPFIRFFSATFLGKSVFKAGLQSISVIVIFSKDNVNTLIKFTERLVPSVGGLLHAWIDRQKLSFQGQHVPETGVNVVSVVWNGILVLMLGYFVLTTLEALANMEYESSDNADEKDE